MKVLWFSNSPANADEYFNSELRGTGGWIKSLNKEMQNVIDLHIAFPVDYPMKPFDYQNTRYYPINKYKYQVEKVFRIVLNKINMKSLLKQYLEILDSVQPDIIHIHGTELPFIMILKYTNIPVAVSIQGNMTVYSHKYYSGIELKYGNIKAGGDFFRSVFLPYKFSKGAYSFVIRGSFERKYLKHCKFIIGRTAWDRRITRILAPTSTYYHSDEILRDSFYKSKWKNNFKDKFSVLTITDNVIYKGFETLCFALTLLNELNENIIWKVVGVKESDLIVKVVKKKLGKKYPVKNLKLLGKLNENELIEEMIRSNLFVMPSHIENSPNSLCEAQIIGMPCVATYAGGTGSLLLDGKDGLLIQDGDPWAMAGACLEMKTNYKNATTMGENARIRALRRHHKEHIALSLLDTYKKVIKNDGDKRK